MINDHKAQGKCKIQLTIAINFMSSKDSNEMCTLHSKSNNLEILMHNETDEFIKETFESHLQKYKKGFEKSMKGSEFVFVYYITNFIK